VECLFFFDCAHSVIYPPTDGRGTAAAADVRLRRV